MQIALSFRLMWVAIFVMLHAWVQGQPVKDTIAQPFSDPTPIDENLLVGTKWRYTHTYHAPNKLIVHKANASYEYYVHLKYDNTVETYLNGSRIKGQWKLNDEKNQLYYAFRNNHWWGVDEISETKLVLSFSMNDVEFQYHYDRVESETAPFVAPLTELPEVEVEETVILVEPVVRKKEKRQQRKADKRGRRIDRKAEKQAKKNAKFKMEPGPPPIEIGLVGGGYYGGVDPIVKNYLQIKSSGRLIKEFESLNGGLVKTKKDIPRSELEKLITFIESKDFFEYENYYDCKTKDCLLRKTKAPLPVPLRLSIQYGNKRKVVTVSIWGPDQYQAQYVDYPRDLELIIDGIQKLAEMESSKQQ